MIFGEVQNLGFTIFFFFGVLVLFSGIGLCVLFIYLFIYFYFFVKNLLKLMIFWCPLNCILIAYVFHLGN